MHTNTSSRLINANSDLDEASPGWDLAGWTDTQIDDHIAAGLKERRLDGGRKMNRRASMDSNGVSVSATRLTPLGARGGS